MHAKLGNSRQDQIYNSFESQHRNRSKEKLHVSSSSWGPFSSITTNTTTNPRTDNTIHSRANLIEGNNATKCIILCTKMQHVSHLHTCFSEWIIWRSLAFRHPQNMQAHSNQMAQAVWAYLVLYPQMFQLQHNIKHSTIPIFIYHLIRQIVDTEHRSTLSLVLFVWFISTSQKLFSTEHNTGSSGSVLPPTPFLFFSFFFHPLF